MTPERRPPLRPGDTAPDFELPAVNRDGTVSLAAYRGKSPVLIGLFRGLHCPFCRRQLVQLGTTKGKLEAFGVETVAVVNTPLDRARQYFAYRPTRVLLAADPDAATHRDFGVPSIEIVRDEAATSWPERATMRQLLKVPIDVGEEMAPTNFLDGMKALNKMDAFELTETDERIMATHWTLLSGHFLIDRQGIVRWARVEGASGIGDLARFPGDDEILDAVRAVASAPGAAGV